jgi:hypothetical protein
MDANGVLSAAFDPTARALRVTVDTDAEVASTKNTDANAVISRVLIGGNTLAVVVVG